MIKSGVKYSPPSLDGIYVCIYVLFTFEEFLRSLIKTCD